MNQPGLDSSPSTKGAVWSIARKGISFPVMLGTLLAAGAFASTSWGGGVPGSKIFVEGDTWWHLTTGERILTTHTWPTREPYSFTANGDPWIAYEWLGEVAMARAEHLGALRGLSILLIALSITIVLLLYYLAWLRCQNSKAAMAACALILPVLGSFFNLRPQILGYIFLVVMLICLERFRQGREKAVWVLPALFVAWVNTHGTFVLGLGILGLNWLCGLLNFRRAALVAIPWTGRQRRELLVVILLCTAAVLVSPYGSRLAAYPLDVVLNQPLNLASDTEWYSIASFGENLSVKLFLILVLLFLLAYAVVSPAVYRVEEIVLLLIATYQASFHVRFLFFFSLVFAPMLAAMLARWIPAYQREKDKYALNAVIMALVLGTLALRFPSNRDLQDMLPRKAPEGAVNFLRQHPNLGPTLNESVWGGFLIWSGQKVFIDGRLDVYERTGVLADYLRIMNLDPSALSLLRKYGVKACLLKKDSPLGTYLAALPGWKRVYADDLSVIYEEQGLDRDTPH